jgi:pumilio RNA-binding family
MEQLSAGGLARVAAFNQLRGYVQRLSIDPVGCRTVQLALDLASPREIVWMAAELHGFVLRAIHSPYGNYVIQKVVTQLPTNVSSFVAEEISGNANEIAKHRFGCRILSRIVEHMNSAADVKKMAVVNELLATCDELNDVCRHSFGHHVIQSILEHGFQAQKHSIATALASDLSHNSRNRNATYVIERAFQYCSAQDQHLMARALLDNSTDLHVLADHQFGSHVVRALIRQGGQVQQEVSVLLSSSLSHLSESRYGSRVVEELHHCQVNGSAATARSSAALAATAA